MLFFTLLALALRLALVSHSVDVPGDGPIRAVFAYDWSRAPHIETHGSWLPGFTYLAGSFAFLVPSTSAPRVFNLLLGASTVPLFYGLVRHVYGRATAWFATAILVFLPLHVGLSASSLTEITFLFEMVAGMWFVIVAGRQREGCARYVVLSVLCLGWAAMTRYEAWVLIPIFPLYHYVTTKRLLTSLAMLFALMVFPILWLFGNHVNLGDALAGFRWAAAGTETGARAVNVFRAIRILGFDAVAQLGWILPVAAIVGLIVQTVHWTKHGLRPAQCLYTAVFSIAGLVMVRFAMVRGESLWVRYLLFSFVTALPFTALAFTHLVSTRRRYLAVIVMICLAFMGASVLHYQPEVYVTRQQPTDIQALAVWLHHSRFRDEAILLTKMDWRSSYLFLYTPEVLWRALIFSYWTTDVELQEFLARQKPALLITSDQDDKYQSHFERLWGKQMRDEALIYRQGPIKVYDLTS